jgi:hypothetical protein
MSRSARRHAWHLPADRASGRLAIAARPRVQRHRGNGKLQTKQDGVD